VERGNPLHALLPGALVKTLEHFASLPEEERGAVAELLDGPVRRAAARSDIVREGDDPRVMRLFLDGWGLRYKVLANGRRQVLSFILPGDLCEPRAFLMERMDHSIAAVTRLTYIEIARSCLERTVEQYPRISRALWRQLMLQNAMQREWTVSLGQRTAIERLAHLICETFYRLRGVGLAGKPLEFPLSQVDLADALGMSAVHVNRSLQELRRQGLIRLHARRLEIPDIDALAQAGLYDSSYLRLSTDPPHQDGFLDYVVGYRSTFAEGSRA